MKKRFVELLLSLTVVVVLTTGCSQGKNVTAESSGIVSTRTETETTENTVSTAEASDTERNTEKMEDTNLASEVTPTEAPTEEIKVEAPAATPVPAPISTPTPAPEYTVTSMDATMYAKQSVNVRKGPSTDYEKVGSLSQGQKVKVTGKASTGWYEISYDGATAYVSGSYLTDTKPIASTSGPLDQTTNKGSGTSNFDPNDPSLAYLVYSAAEMDEAYNRGDLATYQAMIYANFEAYCALVGMDSGPVTSVPIVPGDSGNSGSTVLTVNTTVDFVNYLNGQREAQGIQTLVWNSDLESVALERASELVDNFSHDGMRSCSAEIILKTTEAEVDSWYNSFYSSRSHKTTMLWPYDEVAAAYAEIGGTYYVVVLFYI